MPSSPIGPNIRAKRRSVVVADDHALTRAGVRGLLAEAGDFEVVAEVEDGLQAISAIKRLRPDLAVLDIRMPHANGAEVFIEGRRWSPQTRFVVLTGLGTVALFRELIAARVDGLFLKTGAVDGLRHALAQLMAGRQVIDAEVQALLAKADAAPALTRRELQVLQALARGETNQGIGTLLGISPKTVDTHRTNLMAKLDVRSTAALVARAMRDGLLD